MLGILGWVLLSDLDQGINLASDLGIRFVLASVVGLGGLAAAGVSWSLLAETSVRQGLSTFGTTLPLRHLPLGGFGQIAGLSGMAVAIGARSERVALAAPAFMAVTAAGASVVALPMVWDPATPLWIRGVVLVSLALTAALVWGGPRLLEKFIGRWYPRLAGQKMRFRGSIAWSAVAMVGAATSFAILFPSAGSAVGAITGFAAAWLCGYLFVVAPAGLGIREVTLMALWPEVEGSTVVATALAHRLTTLVGELMLFTFAWWISRDWVRARERSV